MEEFGSEMRAGIDEAVQQLIAARFAGDDHGAQLLAGRVRYLLKVARGHGVDVADPAELGDLPEGWEG